MACMPELPEVQTVVARLDSRLRGAVVHSVRLLRRDVQRLIKLLEADRNPQAAAPSRNPKEKRPPAAEKPASTAPAGSAASPKRERRFVIVDQRHRSAAGRLARAANEQLEMIAQRWFGEPAPTWTEPCAIRWSLSPHAKTGGFASYVFKDGRGKGR